jgi:hypothetical protein
MTNPTGLALVLALLGEEPSFQPVEGLFVRGSADITDERRAAVVEHVCGSVDAQLTLFLLAAELKADAVADETQLETELRTFATAVRERFGVNILRTAREHRDRVPDTSRRPCSRRRPSPHSTATREETEPLHISSCEIFYGYVPENTGRT